MTVKAPAIPEKCRSKLFPGEWAARYTYEASDESDWFDVRVLIGRLSSSRLEFIEAEGAHAIPVQRAAGVEAAHSYVIARKGLAQVPDVRSGTAFSYDGQMLLRNMISPNDILASVAALNDRRQLEARGNNWQRTVIGADAICAMQRALFVASGDVELNIGIYMVRARSDAEIRSAALQSMGGIAMHAFTSMSPVQV